LLDGRRGAAWCGVFAGEPGEFVAGVAGGFVVAALFGFKQEAVEKANGFPAAAVGFEQKSGATADFNGLGPRIGKAEGECGGDFGEECPAEFGLRFPGLEVAMEDVQVALAESAGCGRGVGRAVPDAGLQRDGLREIGAEFSGQPGGEAGGVAGGECGREGLSQGGAEDLNVGVAAAEVFERLVEMGEDGERATGRETVIEFGVDEGGFAVGAADPEDRLKMGGGVVGEGVGGVRVRGGGLAGGVDEGGPPVFGVGGGVGADFDAGIGGQKGSEPAFDGALEEGWVFGVEEGPAFEEFGIGAGLQAGEGDGGIGVVVHEAGPGFATEGSGGGEAIEEDEQGAGAGALLPGFGDGDRVFLDEKGLDPQILLQPFGEARGGGGAARRTTDTQLHPTI
jgi:hypothetical protein